MIIAPAITSPTTKSCSNGYFVHLDFGSNVKIGVRVRFNINNHFLSMSKYAIGSVKSGKLVKLCLKECIEFRKFLLPMFMLSIEVCEDYQLIFTFHYHDNMCMYTCIWVGFFSTWYTIWHHYDNNNYNNNDNYNNNNINIIIILIIIAIIIISLFYLYANSNVFLRSISLTENIVGWEPEGRYHHRLSTASSAFLAI